MAYDFKALDQHIAGIAQNLEKELAGVRTGRAAPTILDGILVESYGAKMPISNVATISIEDPRTLRIAAWDASQNKEIEKAIIHANLDLSVGADEKGVRVFFPELTSERRASLLKLAKERVEEARSALRVSRDEVWSAIQSRERDGTMSEDDKFRAKDDMQKRVDAANKKFEEALERKEKELSA